MKEKESETPTPIQYSAAVTGMGRERAELLAEVEALKAQLARLAGVSQQISEYLEYDMPPYGLCKELKAALADPSTTSALQWLAEQRQAARAEERERCAKVAESLGKPTPVSRPTIEELEYILQSESSQRIYVEPDGSVTTEIPLALRIAAAIRKPEVTRAND